MEGTLGFAGRQKAGCDMNSKPFVFEKRVYLTDTNAEGNVYFSRFFDLQGIAREEFFRQNVLDHMEIMQSGTRLITTNAWMVYQHEAHLFDEIAVQVQTANLKQMSLELVFTFTDKAGGKVIGRGGQKLAFSDRNGRLITIPASILENAKRFLSERAPELQELDLRKPARVSQ